MRVLVTFAMDWEWTYWRRRLGSGNLVEAGQAVVYAMGPLQVVVALTGVGPVAAEYRARTLLDQLSVDLWISAGFAGALRAELRPGVVLVGQQVRSQSDGQLWHAPQTWLQQAMQAGARPARLLTVAHVATAAEKRRMGSVADAVDMESAAIVAAAAARSIPVLAVRAVADPLERDVPGAVEQIVDPSGRVRGRAVLNLLTRRPWMLTKLLPLAADARSAGRALAAWMDRFLIRLAVQQPVAPPSPVTVS
jgi:adenosylhomocysteine nucleosidase